MLFIYTQGFPAQYFSVDSFLKLRSEVQSAQSVLCYRIVFYSYVIMPKPQYTQKFRDSWLQDPNFKDWLQVIESTAGQVAKCKFCGTTLRSHYGDLKSH